MRRMFHGLVMGLSARGASERREGMGRETDVSRACDGLLWASVESFYLSPVTLSATSRGFRVIFRPPWTLLPGLSFLSPSDFFPLLHGWVQILLFLVSRQRYFIRPLRWIMTGVITLDATGRTVEVEKRRIV